MLLWMLRLWQIKKIYSRIVRKVNSVFESTKGNHNENSTNNSQSGRDQRTGY